MTIRRPPSDLLFIYVAFATSSLARSVIAPILAEIRDEFDVSFTAIGLLVSMQSLAPMVVHLLAGYAADRFAPRIPISGGSLLLAVGTAAAALAPNFSLLMVGVLVAGVGGSFMMTSGLALTVRRAEPRQRGRATSRVMTGVQVGAFLGPALGGLAASGFGWRAALALAAAVALAVAVAAWTLVRLPRPATGDADRHRLSFSSFRLSRPVLGVVVLAVVMSGAIQGTRSVVLPLYGSTALSLDPAGVGLVVSLVAGVRTVAMFFGGNVMDWAGRGAALMVNLIAGMAAALLLLLPASLGVYGLIGACIALGGTGAALPSVLIGDRSPPDRVGVALGILMSVGSAVTMGAVTGVGYLLDVSGFGTVGLAVTVPLVAATLLGLRVVGLRRPAHTQP